MKGTVATKCIKNTCRPGRFVSSCRHNISVVPQLLSLAVNEMHRIISLPIT